MSVIGWRKKRSGKQFQTDPDAGKPMTHKRHSDHPHDHFNNTMEHMTGFRVPGVGTIEKKEIGTSKRPKIP